MKLLSPAVLASFLCALVLACSSGSGGGNDSAVATSGPTEAPPAVLPATATPAPTPTPVVVRRDIRATHLAIPSLGIDANVQMARTIPDTSVAPPGCPPRPPDNDTLVVPNSGIATPMDNLEGFENKAWIFGHSRYLGAAQTFLALEDIKLGDELIVDGIDRASGETIAKQRFVVNGLYLTDTDSGGTLIQADSPTQMPVKPTVILQTSVREDGAGKSWILNQQKLLSKTQNLVKGDLNDPCKYLLLFVFAT